MSKSLREVPPETLERWKRLSQPKPKKRAKKKRRTRFPSTSKLPSLHLLRAETERLRNAESQEEMREIQGRIQELKDRVMEEGKEMREQAMERVKNLRQERMIRVMMPHLTSVEKRYECPKCHTKYREGELNFSVKGKGKHKKKVPWCLRCNLQIYSEGDKRLKEVIIPLKNKKCDVTFLSS